LLPIVWTALIGATLLVAPVQVNPAEARAEQAQPAVGTIAGHITPPEDSEIVDPLQAVLMDPRWVDIWNGDVQKRLDVYSERYRAAFARNRDFFDQVSNMARRDAIVFVISRMQRDLGATFQDLVREVSGEGRFEFREVPFGEYQVIVLARRGRTNLIWVETVEIKGPIPQFIEVENRIQ
jgi:hypothetical protein